MAEPVIVFTFYFPCAIKILLKCNSFLQFLFVDGIVAVVAISRSFLLRFHTMTLPLKHVFSLDFIQYVYTQSYECV